MNETKEDWLLMEDAPRDGRWLILEVETGGHLFEPRVGRFAPQQFETGIYEWQVICRMPEGIYNYYAEGRIAGWLPMPAAPTS